MQQYTAQQILKVRDALVDRDLDEAYHQLYTLADPEYKIRANPWEDVERIAATPSPAKAEQEGPKWVNCSERMPNGFYVKFSFRTVEDKRPISIKDIQPKQLHCYEWLDVPPFYDCTTPPVKEVEPDDSLFKINDYARQQGITDEVLKILHKKAAVWNKDIYPHMLKGLLNGWCMGYRSGKESAPVKEAGQPVEDSLNLPIEELIKLSDEDLSKEIDKVRSRLGMGKCEQSQQQPVDGPWKFEVVHSVTNNESSVDEVDEYVTISDGSLTLYIEQHEDEEGEQKLVNLLNQLKAKLSRTDDNEFMMYEYKRMYHEAIEEIKKLQPAPSGLRWIDNGLPEFTWRGPVITQRPDGTTGQKLATLTEDGWVIEDRFNNEWVIKWLSDSPAPVQVDPVNLALWVFTKVNCWDKANKTFQLKGEDCYRPLSELLDKYTQSLQPNP